MDDFKTSQTDFSGVDGQDAGAPAVQYGTETSGAPGPVTQPMKGESIKTSELRTTQQIDGEFSLPGNDQVEKQ